MARRKFIPIPQLSEKDLKRFYSKFDKRGSDECWPWIAGTSKDGYGMFRLPTCNLRAPRIAYFLRYGKDPGEYEVCHRCDFPGCVNPKCLFLGSTKDNAIDRARKGRGVHGERHWATKLSNSQVLEVIALYSAGGVTQYQLADKFGVKQSTIFNIVNGNSRRNIRPAGADESIAYAVWTGRARVLTVEIVNAIRAEHLGGSTMRSISDRWGIYYNTVRSVVNRKTWYWIP